MKIAALQMVSAATLDTNLARARALLEAAAEAGAELAVLPEHFCLLGRHDTDKLAIREPFGNGPVQHMLARAARELQLWVVGGTLPLATDDPTRARNSALVFSPAGDCVARYDKVHLFQYDNGHERYDEARVLEPGREPVMFTLTARDGQTWQAGLSVCYDLRFAELYRGYAARGADLLLVPSAFTFVTGQAHWEVLLRARAIENMAYVLAPAQGGQHENGRRTWGHSMLVDPWGVVLDKRAEGEGLVLGTLERARLAACRRQLPALEHRVL